jgi:hypothetical protein
MRVKKSSFFVNFALVIFLYDSGAEWWRTDMSFASKNGALLDFA